MSLSWPAPVCPHGLTEKALREAPLLPALGHAPSVLPEHTLLTSAAMPSALPSTWRVTDMVLSYMHMCSSAQKLMEARHFRVTFL